MKKSIVRVSNIYVEDLFEWFYTHVMDSCGDGSGVIVCENYREVADWFKEWHSKKYNEFHKWFHPRDEYENIVNYHDMNENFIFSNSIVDMFDKEYIFIVEEDCHFGHSNVLEDKKLIGIGKNG